MYHNGVDFNDRRLCLPFPVNTVCRLYTIISRYVHKIHTPLGINNNLCTETTRNETARLLRKVGSKVHCAERYYLFDLGRYTRIIN